MMGLGISLKRRVQFGSLPPLPTLIQSIPTQVGTSPSASFSMPAGTDAVRVWTGETPVSEPWFFLYVNRNGVTTKVKLNRFEARTINVPAGGSVGFSTADGRSIQVAADVRPAALGTVFPVAGVANADMAGPPIWSPSGAHITLPPGQRQYEIVGGGTERIVFVAEHDGVGWSNPRWLRLPAAGSIRLHSTFDRIALANYDGATIAVNAPVGSVIGGASAQASLAMPPVTGTTRNVTDVATLKTAIAAAVAGDEIVLDAGTYNLDVNITAASFTSNNGVGGRVGAEGILIRGATSDRTLYIIGCAANGQGDWNLNQGGAALRTGFRDLTFSFTGSNTAAFTLTRGRFAVQNCRFTGTIGAALDCFNGVGSTSTNGLYLDAYRCQADTSVADCWNFNDGNTTANLVRIIDCIGHTAGSTSADQTLTTHTGLHISVYGGWYYNANTNVIATDGSTSPIHCFFTRASRGARQGTVVNSNVYGCRLEQPATSIVGWTAHDWAIGSYVEAGVRESSNNANNYEGNWFNNAGAIGSYYGYFPNVNTTTTFERNVVQSFNVGIRMDNGAGPGSQSANRNSMVSCAFALSKTTTFTSSVNGNVSRLSTTRGVAVDATGMANLSVSYNTWDGTADPDYVPGSNDVAATAGLGTTFLPTAAGNCDGTGNPAAIDWVGGTDYVGFLLEISSVTRDRGARCRPRIMAGAELTPDLW